MAWLLPDGGPFRVPGADIGTGVLAFGLGVEVAGPAVDGPAVGDGRTGVGEFTTVHPPEVVGGTTMSTVQWAPRPRMRNLWRW